MRPTLKVLLGIFALVLVAGIMLEKSSSETLRVEGTWVARLEATTIGRFIDRQAFPERSVVFQTFAIARADNVEVKNSAYFSRAVGYFMLHRYNLALRDLDSAIALKGLSPQNQSEDMMLRAQYKFQSGDFAGTESDCSRLLGLPQKLPLFVFVLRGWARIYLGKPELAVTDFSSAIAALPATRVQMQNSVQQFPGLFPTDRRKALAEIARGFNSTVSAVYASRAAAYRALGQYDKSVMDYDTAIKSSPNMASLYAGRARTDFAAGLWGAALGDFWTRNEIFWRLQG
jgi:tetratricopeptide (TPR) repeat protein